MPPPPPPTSDLDGDGWVPPGDCDDNDASINPDAVDVPYNGVDEDCSGSDERDVDGDGHEAVLAGGEDCNDANALVFPGAEECCDNGTDEVCDEEIDEACDPNPDPGEPGGLAWACGVTGGLPCSWLVLLAGVFCLNRRRLPRFRR